jgi:hypothetical protein
LLIELYRADRMRNCSGFFTGLKFWHFPAHIFFYFL